MNEYLNFASIVEKISHDKKLIPDLMKAENGNNFRAISESAILDAISPILEENGIYYTVEIKDSKLDIREAFGSKGKKLQFIATITIKLTLFNHCQDDAYPYPLVCIESVGMGIDDNDKAMGKAYTYAIKYALLKLFRLRYGDDPDFKVSEPLHTEKPKEKEIKPEKENIKPKTEGKLQKKGKSQEKEIPMSEAQRDYIIGLMKKYDIPEKQILEKFGYEPTIDEFIPMKVARAIIKWFESGEALPF